MTTERVRVETPARLHVGFLNLSEERKRLYGGIGVGVDAPRAVVEAERAGEVHASDDSELVRRAVDTLGVEGARVSFERRIPRHVGLGSGTQHALAVLHAVGAVYGVEPTHEDVRELGRGVRSGVGVGVFEHGGFVVDSGHPASEPHGERTVPEIASHHPLPSDWRFVVVTPRSGKYKGSHGDEEKQLMNEVVENADASVTDEVARTVFSSVLPGVAEDDLSTFGEGVRRVESLNGRWYSDAQTQESEYAEISKRLVKDLRGHDAVEGVGQSSWGPTVYGVTNAEDAETVASSVEEVTSSSVRVVAPDNQGARITRLP